MRSRVAYHSAQTTWNIKLRSYNHVNGRCRPRRPKSLCAGPKLTDWSERADARLGDKSWVLSLPETTVEEHAAVLDRKPIENTH